MLHEVEIFLPVMSLANLPEHARIVATKEAHPEVPIELPAPGLATLQSRLGKFGNPPESRYPHPPPMSLVLMTSGAKKKAPRGDATVTMTASDLEQTSSTVYMAETMTSWGSYTISTLPKSVDVRENVKVTIKNELAESRKTESKRTEGQRTDPKRSEVKKSEVKRSEAKKDTSRKSDTRPAPRYPGPTATRIRESMRKNSDRGAQASFSRDDASPSRKAKKKTKKREPSTSQGEDSSEPPPTPRKRARKSSSSDGDSTPMADKKRSAKAKSKKERKKGDAKKSESELVLSAQSSHSQNSASSQTEMSQAEVTSQAGSTSQPESSTRQKTVDLSLANRFLKVIHEGEADFAIQPRELMNQKIHGIECGTQPASMFPARIFLPCPVDRTARNSRMMSEIPERIRSTISSGMVPNQVMMKSLPEWKFRQWSCSNNTILREWTSMASFLEDIQAPRRDWEDVIADQKAEIEGKPWEVNEDDFTVGLGLYAFLLSVLHGEMLETMCDFPPHSKVERQVEALTGEAAEERDVEMMAELRRLMEIMMVRGDPRTAKTHWYLRVVGKLVLKHELLAQSIFAPALDNAYAQNHRRSGVE